MFRRKCKITFIKHGSTIYSEENRMSDKQNYPPLSEIGKIEATNIANWIQKRSPKVDKIYSSSDLRTVQTSKIIAKEYNTNFEIIDNLYSRRYGKWSGLTFKQVEKKYPEELYQYHENRAEYKIEDGESLIELTQRIREVISTVIAENTGKRIIIVTHGDIIQSEICSALGIPLENHGQIYIPCGSATQLSYFDDWTSLVYSGHLPL